MHEFFDHTADLGIRVRAATLSELFQEAAKGLTAAIVENPESIQSSMQESVAIPGHDRIDLLFDWLRHLLLRFETQGLLFTRFVLAISESGLTAEIFGEPCDTARHQLSHEVKAITYHGLIVEESDLGWLAEVIVDI